MEEEKKGIALPAEDKERRRQQKQVGDVPAGSVDYPACACTLSVESLPRLTVPLGPEV